MVVVSRVLELEYIGEAPRAGGVGVVREAARGRELVLLLPDVVQMFCLPLSGGGEAARW